MTHECSLRRETVSSLSVSDVLQHFLHSGGGRAPHLADNNAQSRHLNDLHGELVMLGNWTCEDGCRPPHEEEDKTPGVHNRPHCIENSQAGSLHLREDIDLGCLDSNITCDDIKANETLRQPEKLYTDCTLDPELLQGECIHLCRFERHPTRRCEYWFDRNNKYGMHGKEGMYGFGHCVWYSGCVDNSTTEEQNYLVCNTTETHEIVQGMTTSLETSTSTTSTTTNPTTTTTFEPIVAPSASSDDSEVAAASGVGVVVILGSAAGGATVVLICVVLLWLLMRRRQKPKEGPVQANESIVVGRPVPGVAPPAGYGDGKDEKVAQGAKVEP